MTMLGLPLSTEVNQRIPKEKLYAEASMPAQLRGIIKEQVEAVIWRNKLAAGTVGIAAGESVEEIQVFELCLRRRGLDGKALATIAAAIPYKILFVLTFGDEAQAWMEAAGTFYGTDWLPADGLALRFEGLDLDALYESLVRQIAGGRLSTEGDIGEAVQRDRRRRELEREIAALEKKVLREKQFNRQVEVSGKLRKLRGELEGING